MDDGGQNSLCRGSHGGVPPPSNRADPPAWDATHEFVVSLHRCPRSWLWLPHPFARAVEGNRPMGLWLRDYGCYNGHVWVAVDISPSNAIFLTRGGKSFARSRGLCLEHILYFSFDGETMLSVRFFGSSDSRMDCCVESSSSRRIDTSSDDDDDDSIPGAKLEGNDSE
ncbi:l-ascorbate oxidase-like protein [Hordeum vulgare]|nr:l-ascorbate oxidase-like protein [Hordeum vulgare]